MSKPIIDFEVLYTADPRQILVADFSDWLFIESKPSIIEITVPGTTTPNTKFFTKGSINNFNSVNLATTCTTCTDNTRNYLPDGIYNIKVIGSPDTFYKEKKHLQTAKTRLEADLFLTSFNLVTERIDERKYKVWQQINLLLDYAEASTRRDNLSEAQAALFKAQELLADEGHCLSCF